MSSKNVVGALIQIAGSLLILREHLLCLIFKGHASRNYLIIKITKINLNIIVIKIIIVIISRYS